MATSGGHLLVPKALRVIKFVAEKTSRIIREKLPQSVRTARVEQQPAYALNNARQPKSRIEAILRGQSRSYSTQQAFSSTARHLSSSPEQASRVNRSSFPSSRTGHAVRNSTSRTHFASTLRPNVTGGTLCRSAGGYGLGAGRVGGVRHFSHSPAAPSEVINNVSQAVRSFWLSGQKAHFDGINPKSGEKQFKAVTALQHETGWKISSSHADAPGSYLDFQVTPTITAVGPFSSIPRAPPTTQGQTTLNSEGFMDILSVDFTRALNDLSMIMNDLKQLAALGDLAISLPNRSTLRVRFPGCDAEAVENLCKELGIRRGIVYQDPGFDSHHGTEMALLFPFAPSNLGSEVIYSPNNSQKKREEIEWQEMMSPDPLPIMHSNLSMASHDFEEVERIEANDWLSPPSDYSSLHGSDHDNTELYFTTNHARDNRQQFDYEGLEGVYRFLEECGRAKR